MKKLKYLILTTFFCLLLPGCKPTQKKEEPDVDVNDYIEIVDNSDKVRPKLVEETKAEVTYSFNASYDEEGVKAIEYDGATYKNEPTKVFAYIGYPSTEGKHPAVVLVHGGGGTAFAEWVRIWNERGYVAIAMDTEGKRPDNSRDGLGGPYTDYMMNPRIDIQDQWMFQAVSTVIRATTILANDEHVDNTKIGIVGISWGSVICSIALGCDDRYSFGVPIYGSGFLYDSRSAFASSDRPDAMYSLYDPSLYFKYYKAKIMYANSDHDPHFSSNITSKSATILGADLVFIAEHTHGHDTAWKINEVYEFADSMTENKTTLPYLRDIVLEEGIIKGKFMIPENVSNSFIEIYAKNDILEYSNDAINGSVINSDFEQVDVSTKIDKVNGRFEVTVPSNAKIVYVNIASQIDDKTYRQSTPLFDINNGIPVIVRKVLLPADQEEWKSFNDFDDNLLDAYLKPYWFTREIYNETCMFVGEEGESTLMFEPTEIKSITDYRLQKTYVEGRDYVVNGRIIKRLKGSEIPYWEYDEYFIDEDEIQDKSYGVAVEADMSKTDIPFDHQKYLKYGEFATFTDKQIAVTYRHDDVYTGKVPEAQQNKLERVLSKLRNGENIDWMVYGDSVATGCNASGTEQGGLINPHMPDAYNLSKLYLEKKYTSQINIENQAVGGWKISECLNAYNERIKGKHIDLMILRIGGNDTMTSEDEYKEMLNSLINKFFDDNPSANLIIQTPELSNQQAVDAWTHNIRNIPAWSEDVMNVSSYVNQIAIADVQAFTNWILGTGKLSRDVTGNNVNHSNDFIIRSYAQILLKTMLDSGYCVEKYK